MRLLIIEDDQKTASYLAQSLTASGYIVDCAFRGDDGLRMAQEGTFDVLIVDRMLPGYDGLDLVAALRKEENNTPVLFLSALDHVDERVKGLAAGGDDYLVKPFVLSELIARIEALIRRRKTEETRTKLVVGDLVMDLISREVRRDNKIITLQLREFRLLEYLMRNSDRPVTRAMLLENLWNYHFDPQTNVIDVHISRLRHKIDKDFPVPLLQTIRGVGYKLTCPYSPS